MKKVIISICIILLLTSCKDETINDNTISELTKNIMFQKETGIKNEDEKQNTTILEEDNSKKETTIEENKETVLKPKENIIKNDVVKEKVIETKDNENNETTEVKDNEISETDKTTDDYDIHKGKIDCITIDECMELSLPIQYELKNSIDNIFYLQVKDNKQNPIGYYIEYHLKDYKYDDYDTCLKKSEYLKEKLSDRINNYNCTEEGILAINKEVITDD